MSIIRTMTVLHITCTYSIVTPLVMYLALSRIFNLRNFLVEPIRKVAKLEQPPSSFSKVADENLKL